MQPSYAIFAKLGAHVESVMPDGSKDDQEPLDRIVELLMELHRLTAADKDPTLRIAVDYALTHVMRRLTRVIMQEPEEARLH